ncbi:MAG: hypothetical protein JSS20_02900 [Proteobacteria bacterium]|nr:hypothetical protein [Pseudomonadota bacterium]
MTEQGPVGRAPAEAASEASQRLAGTVLVRIACAAASEATAARDVHALLGSGTLAEIWRIEFGRLVAALVAGGLVERIAGELHATSRGIAAATEFLGAKKGLPSSWETARDHHLIAKALGLASAPQSRRKLLAKAEGLRLLIVASHWQLKTRGAPSASRLRSALAVKALERAFGNQMRQGLGDKSALPAKASRLLASQLSTSGREFGTDSRLIAALATEAVGARRADLKSLRLAVLKKFLGREEATDRATKRKLRLARRAERAAPQPPIPTPPPAAAIAELSPPPPVADAPAIVVQRPGPEVFASAVLAATDETAEGWAGNRKAFISKVWERVQARHAGWQLTEIEFKCMLTEAHRTGLLVLANADLKDKRALRELQASAVVYKNTVWHYVRAAD